MAGPGGRTLVALHGYGMSSYTWRHWLPTLRRHGRVLLVDLKGFGAAAKPDDGAYSMHDQASLLLEYLEREGAERLTLVGHSMGGGVGLLVTLGLADRGRSAPEQLLVVAAIAYEQRLPPFVRLAHHPRLSRAGLRLLGAERVVRWTARAVVHDPAVIEEDAVRAYARSLASREGFRGALRTALQIVPPDLPDVTARYPEIDVPSLLVWGRQDPVVPVRVGERLVEALPAARLEVLDKCGHLPQEEYPERTAALVDAFLGEI